MFVDLCTPFADVAVAPRLMRDALRTVPSSAARADTTIVFSSPAFLVTCRCIVYRNSQLSLKRGIFLAYIACGCGEAPFRRKVNAADP